MYFRLVCPQLQQWSFIICMLTVIKKQLFYLNFLFLANGLELTNTQPNWAMETVDEPLRLMLGRCVGP